MSPEAARICCFIRISVNSAVVCCRLYFFILCRGISKMRHGERSGFNIRKLSHINRRARLRTTDSRLYFLLHITPHSKRSSGDGATTTTIPGATLFTPSRLICSNCDLKRSLSCLFRRRRLCLLFSGAVCAVDTLHPDYAVRRARPF